jgi:hypothetical protein
MKLTASIVALVLGTSSIAMARPATVRGSVSAEASFSVGTRVSARPPVQNGPRKVVKIRAPRWHQQPAVYPTYPAPQPAYENVWVEEGPTYQALRTGNTITGANYNIDIGLDGKNSFNKIRLEARGSVTSISEVRVTFWTTGETQTIRVNEVLSGNQSITLDLEGRDRQVGRVLVYGKSMDGGRSNGFAVLAR